MGLLGDSSASTCINGKTYMQGGVKLLLDFGRNEVGREEKVELGV
jgi:hypothetical protein